MRYQITHTTTYTYDRPVVLSPHIIRLRPRCDAAQKLEKFSLDADPAPQRVSENIELDGNTLLKLWFPEEELTLLRIKVSSVVETYRINPFDFLLEPWAVKLPIDYPISLFTQLQPYLSGQLLYTPTAIDSTAVQMAQELWQSCGGDTISFLTTLNQRIGESCDYSLRESGEALPAGLTWSQKAGSCRDFTVLFVEVCRAAGLAARFVSGYQEGDPDNPERHLHAWAEVYLPGAGWRGFDPTQGLAVGDRYIALVSHPNARRTVPISGVIKQGVGAQSQMHYDLTISPIS